MATVQSMTRPVSITGIRQSLEQLKQMEQVGVNKLENAKLALASKSEVGIYKD
jgi:hypothetical protein